MFPTWTIHIVLSRGLFFVFIEKLLCKQKQKDLAELTTCRNTPNCVLGSWRSGPFAILIVMPWPLGTSLPMGQVSTVVFFYYLVEQYYIVLDDFILKFTRGYSLYVIILKKNSMELRKFLE